MAEKRFSTAHLAEIPPVPEEDPSEPEWKPIRHHFGIKAFGVNLYVVDRPGEVVNEHDEVAGSKHLATNGGHEELYFVVQGNAEFTIDGEKVDAPAGTFVFVQPEGRRSAVAEAGTTILVVGGAAGEAFAVSPWEEKYTRDLAVAG
jgi:hypothetical protein